MSVDVVTEIDIGRPRDEVAAFARDPANATRWYANIASVEWVTPPPAALGTRVAFVAHSSAGGSRTPTRSPSSWPVSGS